MGLQIQCLDGKFRHQKAIGIDFGQNRADDNEMAKLDWFN
jgi:hypothetical protein